MLTSGTRMGKINILFTNVPRDSYTLLDKNAEFQHSNQVKRLFF